SWALEPVPAFLGRAYEPRRLALASERREPRGVGTALTRGPVGAWPRPLCERCTPRATYDVNEGSSTSAWTALGVCGLGQLWYLNDRGANVRPAASASARRAAIGSPRASILFDDVVMASALSAGRGETFNPGGATWPDVRARLDVRTRSGRSWAPERPRRA